MPAASATHLDFVIGIVLFWLAIGAFGLLRPIQSASATRFLYASGAIGGVALAVVALAAIGAPPASLVLPLGLPDLHSTRGLTHCPRSSCSCSARPARGSRAMRPAISRSRTAVKAASRACNTTGFLPAWRWC